jgi:hypothetical protein
MRQRHLLIVTRLLAIVTVGLEAGRRASEAYGADRSERQMTTTTTYHKWDSPLPSKMPNYLPLSRPSDMFRVILKTPSISRIL